MNQSWAKSIVNDVTYLWFALMIVGSVPASFSIMMFDAPGSGKPATIVLAASLMSFPLVCLLSIVMAQRALKVDLLLLAYLWVLVPLANIAVGSAGLAWIQLVQDGRFNG